jgi:hypothetical protein
MAKEKTILAGESAKQQQINLIKKWLAEGMSRKKIHIEIKEYFPISTRTIDLRLKEAKKNLPDLLEQAKQKTEEEIVDQVSANRKNYISLVSEVQKVFRGVISDMQTLAEKGETSQKDFPYLTAFSTATKAGVPLRDLLLLLKNESGNSTEKQKENNNININNNVNQAEVEALNTLAKAVENINNG